MMRKLYAGFLLLVIVACAQLGLQQPDSTPGRIAYGISTVTDVRVQAASLLKAGKITPATARKVQETADMARLGLEQAKNMYFDPVKPNRTEAVGLLVNMENLLVVAQGLLTNERKP